jgi:hypothetical protein
MTNSPTWKRLRWSLVAATGISLIAFGCFYLSVGRKPSAPAVVKVASCKPLAPGMHQVGEADGVQFDAPASQFTFHEGYTDAPPIIHGFGVTPKTSASTLEISIGSRQEGAGAGVDSVEVFSEHVENRKVFDDSGQLVGEDTWGYWDRNKRWRRIHIRRSVYASYGVLNGKVSATDAALFDRVLSSACFPSSVP